MVNCQKRTSERRNLWLFLLQRHRCDSRIQSKPYSYRVQRVYNSGQIIATSYDLTPKGSKRREIPLFQRNLGWWNMVFGQLVPNISCLSYTSNRSTRSTISSTWLVLASTPNTGSGTAPGCGRISSWCLPRRCPPQTGSHDVQWPGDSRWEQGFGVTSFTNLVVVRQDWKPQ